MKQDKLAVMQEEHLDQHMMNLNKVVVAQLIGIELSIRVLLLKLYRMKPPECQEMAG